MNQVDCGTNGEVSSIVYFRKMIFSGHSDGTIKVNHLYSKCQPYLKKILNIFQLISLKCYRYGAGAKISLIRSKKLGNIQRQSPVWPSYNLEINCTAVRLTKLLGYVNVVVLQIHNDISTCVNNSKNKVLIPNIWGRLHKSFFDSVLWAISSINYYHTLRRLGLIGGRWAEVGFKKKNLLGREFLEGKVRWGVVKESSK